MLRLFVAGAVVASLAQASPPPPAGSDPFSVFAPSVNVSAKDRTALDRGSTIARTLPSHDGQVAVFAATSIDATGDRLVSWVREIAQLRSSEYVRAIGRFSPTPRLEDLRALSLEDEDLDAIRHCEPAHCDLKLASSEMAQLKAAIARRPEHWKAAAQQAFRELVLARVRQYLADGHAGLGSHDDKNQPASWDESFDALLRDSPAISSHVPRLFDYLRRFPASACPEIESFLYWSKDQLAGRPQVGVTHIAIVHRPGVAALEVVVAATQVFAIHYVDASLSVTAVVRDPQTGRRYLGYLNRSELDIFGGFFGGLARMIIPRRIKGEAPAVLRAMRERLESGEPQAQTNGGGFGPLTMAIDALELERGPLVRLPSK